MPQWSAAGTGAVIGAALADPHCHCFVAGISDGLVGFALLTEWGAADRITFIRRFAVTGPGKGYGNAPVRSEYRRRLQ
jgi:hypothetical protein